MSPNPSDIADSPTSRRASYVNGIGTALPPHRADQGQIARFLTRAAEAQPDAPPRFARYVDALTARSGIDQRYSVLPDYTQGDPRGFSFFPPRWSLDPFPTTAARMRVYEEAAGPLAERAARRALDAAGVAPGAITHLVITTCTGFFAPGPDVALTEALGLRTEVERTQIGFMGCYAGVTGLRAAHRAVQADPDARVLLVSVELCSLHYQRAPDVETLVCNILFGDGASAAVIGGRGPGPRILGARTHLAQDSHGAMGWRVGDHGFEMRLEDSVPEHLEATVGPFVDGLLDDAALTRADVEGYAIHPGGRRIVERVGAGLGLGAAALAPSLDVLRDVGNLSSATILFVLDRLLASGWSGPGLALAFGPGLTMEGLALDAGPSPTP